MRARPEISDRLLCAKLRYWARIGSNPQIYEKGSVSAQGATTVGYILATPTLPTNSASASRRRTHEFEDSTWTTEIAQKCSPSCPCHPRGGAQAERTFACKADACDDRSRAVWRRAGFGNGPRSEP